MSIKRHIKTIIDKGGIRVRIAVGFLAIFLLCGISSVALVKHLVEQRFTSEITNDMVQIWQNANRYSTQLMIARHYNNDSEGFEEIYSTLQDSLKTEQIGRIYAYSSDGLALYNSINDNLSYRIFHDQYITKLLDHAQRGKATYMLYRDKEVCNVRFVFPVTVSDKIVGILAVERDYSELNQSNSSLVNSIMRIMIIVFISIFVVTLFLLGRWLKPLVELSNYSQSLTEAIANQPVKAFPKLKPELCKRNDEIGLIATDYTNVAETIDNQFKKIESDHKKIIELMEDKQSFFNNVTHELKTPLTTIMGYTQLIRSDNVDDKELLEKGLLQIETESDRLYQMVLQLLEFAKVQNERELVPVDLSDVLMHVVTSMQLKANEAKRELVIESMTKAKILGDENELCQLYMNLIDNAIKYGYENTPITLSVRKSGNQLISMVGNMGQYIPEDKKVQIFEPFYRVDKTFSRKHGSAGLGLSICKKIVEHHKGDINVESEENGFTKFIVVFPRDGEENGVK